MTIEKRTKSNKCESEGGKKARKEAEKARKRNGKKERLDGNVLVEIAFEAATPFGVGSGEGESGEEFGEGTRWRRPVDLAEGVDQILRRDVAPIHVSRRFQKVLQEPSRGCTDGLGGPKNKMKMKK